MDSTDAESTRWTRNRLNGRWQDLTIAAAVLKEGKGLVVGVNKADLLGRKERVRPPPPHPYSGLRVEKADPILLLELVCLEGFGFF